VDFLLVIICTFSLNVTVEMLQAKIARISFEGVGHFQLEFQVGDVPHQPFLNG